MTEGLAIIVGLIIALAVIFAVVIILTLNVLAHGVVCCWEQHALQRLRELYINKLQAQGVSVYH